MQLVSLYFADSVECEARLGGILRNTKSQRASCQRENQAINELKLSVWLETIFQLRLNFIFTTELARVPLFEKYETEIRG